MKKGPFVVTIIGAESSGKTMLAKQLASLFGCNWVPEYAREYLEGLDRPYEFDDLEKIAEGQWESIDLEASKVKPDSQNRSLIDIYPEKKIEKVRDLINQLKLTEQKILIVDSGMLTLRMWARIKYGKQIPFVEKVMKTDPTDLYILSRPRKEWVDDPLREAPDLVDRVWIYSQYLQELSVEKYNYIIL